MVSPEETLEGENLPSRAIRLQPLPKVSPVEIQEGQEYLQTSSHQAAATLHGES